MTGYLFFGLATGHPLSTYATGGVHTKTRNDLKRAGTAWNKLERAENNLAQAGTRKSYKILALERVREVSCNGGC